VPKKLNLSEVIIVATMIFAILVYLIGKWFSKLFFCQCYIVICKHGTNSIIFVSWKNPFTKKDALQKFYAISINQKNSTEVQ